MSIKFNFPEKEFAVEFTGNNAQQYADLFIDSLIAEKASNRIQRLNDITALEEATKQLIAKHADNPTIVLLLKYRLSAITLANIIQDGAQRNKHLEAKTLEQIKNNDNQLFTILEHSHSSPL